MDSTQALSREYLKEAQESISVIDEQLQILLQDTDISEAIQIAFSAVRTIKGTAQLLELDALSQIAEIGNDLLHALRTEQIPTSEATLAVLGDLRHSIDQTVCSLITEQAGGAPDHSAITAAISTLTQPQTEESEVAVETDEDQIKPDQSLTDVDSLADQSLATVSNSAMCKIWHEVLELFADLSVPEQETVSINIGELTIELNRAMLEAIIESLQQVAPQASLQGILIKQDQQEDPICANSQQVDQSHC